MPVQEYHRAVLFCAAKRYAIMLGLAGPFASTSAACQLVMGDLPPERSGEFPTADTSAPESADAGASAQPDSTPSQGTGPSVRSDASIGTSFVDGGLDARALDGSDAAIEQCDGGAPVSLYRDRDEDGYGDPETATFACAPRAYGAWVEGGDDCNDQRSDVHPGQTGYFGIGYRSTTAPTGFSFDYDCDGSETGAPGQRQARDCADLVLLGLGCDGYGFATDAARAAAGVNPYCGSNVVATCAATGLLECTAQLTTSDVRYACN